MAEHTTALERFQRADMDPDNLEKGDMDLSADTANDRTKIASYETPYPFAFQESAVRIALTTLDTFSTGGTGATETFTVTHGLADTTTTGVLTLWSDASGSYEQVQPDSVDPANDSFDYTDGGAVENLDAYYVPTEAVEISIWKEKPGTTGNIGEEVFADWTANLHARNQNEQPAELSFPKSPLQGVVPRKWAVNIYADGPYALQWSDDTNGTHAANAVVQLPILRSPRDIEGLAREVTQDLGNRA